MRKISGADLEELYKNIKKIFSRFWVHPTKMELDIFYQFVFLDVINDYRQSILAHEQMYSSSPVDSELLPSESIVQDFWSKRNTEFIIDFGDNNYIKIMDHREGRFADYFARWKFALSTETLINGGVGSKEDLEIIMAFSRHIIQNIEGLDTFAAAMDVKRGMDIAFQIINTRIYFLSQLSDKRGY